MGSPILWRVLEQESKTPPLNSDHGYMQHPLNESSMADSNKPLNDMIHQGEKMEETSGEMISIKDRHQMDKRCRKGGRRRAKRGLGQRRAELKLLWKVN
jgi:hypothetical protein